jgi:peptidoglycan/LPS O-acetylase OafA/YrhL
MSGEREVGGYRPEIDGLRGIAVLSVVLFHAGFRAFPGGFAGVDIFFVISGYLITGILRRDLLENRLSFSAFYERRARRILPALALVAGCCLPAAWLWLTPIAIHGFGSSLVATLLFVANLYFFRHQDYFAPSTAEQPLVHTWSLAVEEQFYLFFPWLLILWRRNSRSALMMSLSSAALASLILSMLLTPRAPSAAFYLLPGRTWELLLGSLAALASEVCNCPAMTAHTRRTELLCATALLALGIAVFGLDAAVAWPGYAALLPTIASAVLLLCTPFAPRARRCLSHPLLLWPGRVSYSAYLWHQPLFAFAHIAMPGGLSLWLSAFLAGGSFALGYVSWRWVEQPARQSATLPRRSFGVAIGAALSTLLFIAISLHFGRVWPPREGDQSAHADVETFVSAPCFEHHGPTPEQIAKGPLCALGSPIAPASFALLGDSHAAALFLPLARASEARQLTFVALADGFCAPLPGFETPRNPRCADFVDAALDQLVAHTEIRTVFLHAQWALYSSGFRDKDAPLAFGLRDGPRARDSGGNGAVLLTGLQHTVTRLRAAGKRVIVVGPTPEMPYPVLETLARGQLPGIRLFHPLTLSPMTLTEFEQRNAAPVLILRALPDVEYLDARSLYCDADACPALDGAGVPRFSDTNHLTGPGAAPLAEAMLDQLEHRATPTSSTGRVP